MRRTKFFFWENIWLRKIVFGLCLFFSPSFQKKNNKYKMLMEQYSHTMAQETATVTLPYHRQFHVCFVARMDNSLVVTKNLLFNFSSPTIKFLLTPRLWDAHFVHQKVQIHKSFHLMYQKLTLIFEAQWTFKLP